MRLFYAALLADETIRAYEEWVDRLTANHPTTLRRVPRGSLHLTLAFLGEVADGALPSCLEILDGVSSTRGFPFTLRAPRILHGGRRPRLICVDLAAGSDRVARLQKSLGLALRDRLPALSGRAKPPHVTLARFFKGADREAGRAIEREMDRNGIPDREDRLDRVHLVRSTLTPHGPIYRSVGRVDLAN